MQQTFAVGYGKRLGTAQNIELSEERLDMALNGDFSDRQGVAENLVVLILGLSWRRWRPSQ